jgi:hypothetical protein
MQAHRYGKLIFSSYKYGALACSVGAYICNHAGQPISAQDVLFAGGICCGTAAATVTASQGEKFPAAAKKLGKAAEVGKDMSIAGGKYVGQCIAGACKVVIKKVTGQRSIDGPVLSVRAVNVPDEDGNLVARFAEPEQELDEDAVLVSRYAEPEPESSEDNLE